MRTLWRYREFVAFVIVIAFFTVAAFVAGVR